MEYNEKQLVRDNLPELAQNTEVTIYFLSFFRRSGSLATCDIDSLNAKRERTEKACHFYNIIVTRANGFRDLITALTETRQTGALHILKSSSTDIAKWQQDYSTETFLSTVRDINFKAPSWLSQLHSAMENRAQLTITTNSPKITMAKIKEAVGSHSLEILNESQISLLLQILGKYPKNCNNSNYALLLVHQSLPKFYTRVYEESLKYHVVAVNITTDSQSTDHWYERDKIIWSDVENKAKQLEKQVAFQLREIKCRLIDLDLRFGGDGGKLVIDNFPFTGDSPDVAAFLEGHAPLFCKIDVEPPCYLKYVKSRIIKCNSFEDLTKLDGDLNYLCDRKLVQKHLNDGNNTPVMIGGSRQSGLTCLSKHIAQFLIEEKVLVREFQLSRFIEGYDWLGKQEGEILQDFVTYVVDGDTKNLVEAWMTNSSKVNCHVIIDGICDLVESKGVQCVLMALRNVKSIKLWIFGCTAQVSKCSEWIKGTKYELVPYYRQLDSE